MSLMSGVCAAIGERKSDMPTRNNGLNHEVVLREKEISDVSMATFYVFDKEKPGFGRARFAMGAGWTCWSGVTYGTTALESNANPTIIPIAVASSFRFRCRSASTERRLPRCLGSRYSYE